MFVHFEADLVMTILPPAAYITQMKVLRETKQIGSFSIYITAILLISNILRVFFWLTVGFPFNLLIQAFLMIIMQVFPPHSAIRSSIVRSSLRPLPIQVLLLFRKILEVGVL